MNVILKDGFTYTPEWNGNKQEDKPIEIEFQFMTGIEAMDCIMVKDGKAKTDGVKEWAVVCKSVKNFLDGEGKEIDKDIIPTVRGYASLYAECIAAYRLESTVDKKK